MPLAIGPAFAKVLPAGHGGELWQLAGVPATQALPLLQVELQLVYDIETVAGGTNQGARPASQALLSQFLPERIVVADRQQIGQVADVHLQLIGELGPLGILNGPEARHILVGRLSCPRVPGQKLHPRWRAVIYHVGIPDVGQEQVIPSLHRQAPHAFAEGVFVAGLVAVEANNDGFLSLLHVVGVQVVGGECQVEEPGGVDVTGMHTHDNAGLGFDHWLARHRLTQLVFEDGFFWREKKLLGRKEGGVVVQAQLGTIIYRSKDELAVFGHRPYHFPLLHEARHKGTHILLVNHFERHNLLPLPG